jgi:uncharacterized protein YneF (UPF0154 family)
MKILKAILGVILAPIFLSVFFTDRAILVLLPWLQSKTMMSWFRDNKAILESIIRVVFFAIVVLIFKLIF